LGFASPAVNPSSHLWLPQIGGNLQNAQRQPVTSRSKFHSNDGKLGLNWARGFYGKANGFRDSKLMINKQRPIEAKSRKLKSNWSKAASKQRTAETRKNRLNELLVRQGCGLDLPIAPRANFWANMSHEIRNPHERRHSGMTGLALDTELTSEQREYLKWGPKGLGGINWFLDVIKRHPRLFETFEAGKLENFVRSNLTFATCLDDRPQLFAN